MNDTKTLPRPAPNVVTRMIGAEFVAVPTVRRTSELGAIFTMGPVAARLWELLGGVETFEELLDTLESEYDVDRDRLSADVHSFLADSVAEGLLEAAL
ncbi:MAG: PqqD family protein [Deltaproteobacteria bacterium]|nr:PqqD family protein [Deltaproteobacteria bacterium]